MATETGIQWCNHTANFWWGCVEVSPLCDNCYARTLDARIGGNHWGINEPRRFVKSIYADVDKWQKAAKEANERRRVFCMSMGDIFEVSMPVVDLKGNSMNITTDDLRKKIFEHFVPNTPMLDWLFLTKRIENATKMVPDSWSKGWPSNAWILASVGTKKEAERIIPKLVEIPAEIKGISMEPMLEEIDPNLILDGVNWVIIGCESNGDKVNRLSLNNKNDVKTWNEWAVKMTESCQSRGIAVFNKQIPDANGLKILHAVNNNWEYEWDTRLRIREFPK